MIVMSIPMTIISVLMVCVMLLVSKHVTNRSGRYFFAQQTNLGKVNGFIEEMMEGQKVVKVFTHEEEAKFDFDKVNEELFESAYQANKYANILMPLIGNLGYVSYVLVDDKQLRANLEKCNEDLINGDSFVEVIKKYQIYQGMQLNMIQVGFKTGQVDIIMKQLSNSFQEEVSRAIDQFLNIIEPTIVTLLSLVVGIVLMSVMLPLISIMSSL